MPSDVFLFRWKYHAIDTIDPRSMTNVTIVAPPLASTVTGSSPASSSSPPSPGDTSKTKSSHVGAIVGGIVGGLVGLALLALAGLWYWRKRRLERRIDSPEKAPVNLLRVDPEPFPYAHPAADAPSPGLEQRDAPRYAPQPLVLPSSKEREYMYGRMGATAHPGHGAPSSSAYTSNTASTTPGSSRNPPTDASDGPSQRSGTMSPTDVEGLRSEVQNLRLVMQAALQPRAYEPPPIYENGGTGEAGPSNRREDDA